MSEEIEPIQPDSRRQEGAATGDFFSVGVPLHAVRAGYVRRPADDELYEALIAGRYAHVIAPDRSGKSSLIAGVAARLENNGFKVAVLDLAQIGDREASGDVGRWYYSVAYRLLRQLRIRADLQEWWQDKSILSNRQRLLEFYSELVLGHVAERIVVFIDEVQCIEEQQYGHQLLASVRAAHNARATDPALSRLTFVLLGECDSLGLSGEPGLSPFHITRSIALEDFTRQSLDIFATELDLAADDARIALDRIYYWTAGQPYLTQKLARAVARERIFGDIAGHVDRLVAQQLITRNVVLNEPHLGHMHRRVVSDSKRRDKLLNLYGRIRKGARVPTDLGSPLQRRLIALGFLKIDADGELAPRNRIYEAVFTARWANENLPNNWRPVAVAAAIVFAIVATPFWYTQLLPRPYVAELTDDATSLAVASDAYLNFRSFPGHTAAAENLYRQLLERRASFAGDLASIDEVVTFARAFDDANRFPQRLLANYWDRQATAAMREERRDDALLATLESLVVSAPQRRARAAALVADDYAQLLASLPAAGRGELVFNPSNLLLTEMLGARVSQWILQGQALQPREAWTMTALEVTPLVRRVVVDRDGRVGRVGLILNLSHPHSRDLRIKVIAPSGRTVEIELDREQISAVDDIRIPSGQLRELIGEDINGTWTLSIRDEAIGDAGYLIGWNLQLNSQGVIEDFQRGLNIPDPIERETDNVWFGPEGRFAVARASQSDSARVWDLALAKPVRAVALSEAERLLGLSAGARYLIAATADKVNLWDTSTGRLHASLDLGAASLDAILTGDGAELLVKRQLGADTNFELWSLERREITARLNTAGAPALVAIDASGRRMAIADFDRAVRVWNLRSGELVAQIGLDAQPSELLLSTAGDTLGVAYGEVGAALWRIEAPARPIAHRQGAGRWQVALSPSGSKAILGRPGHGFEVIDTRDGVRIGSMLGSGADESRPSLLGFSPDEKLILTAGATSVARFWRLPLLSKQDEELPRTGSDVLRALANHATVATSPDARAFLIGDRSGDVHILSAEAMSRLPLDADRDVNFLGHGRPVQQLSVSQDGRLAASAADDNSIRVWHLDSGLPAPFFVTIPGGPVERLIFSPDASQLAVLSENRLHVLLTATGDITARFDLAEPHHGLAFAGNDGLYLGSASGALSALSQQADGSWTTRSVWHTATAIRLIAVSPTASYLVLVDDNDKAQQLSLLDGRPSPVALQLPSAVQQVAFSPGGSRVLLRTPSWVHRSAVATNGLTWLDAALVPSATLDAEFVFGDPDSGSEAALAERVFLPVVSTGRLQLLPLHFTRSMGPGLFGSREELLEEWRLRLGRDGSMSEAD